jgi:hypothetical protein
MKEMGKEYGTNEGSRKKTKMLKERNVLTNEGTKEIIPP